MSMLSTKEKKSFPVFKQLYIFNSMYLDSHHATNGRSSTRMLV